MNLTGWSKGLEVTGDGEGIVSHAGLALLRQLADKTGLTGGLSRALASPRLLIHDRPGFFTGVRGSLLDLVSGFLIMLSCSRAGSGSGYRSRVRRFPRSGRVFSWSSGRR